LEAGGDVSVVSIHDSLFVDLILLHGLTSFIDGGLEVVDHSSELGVVLFLLDPLLGLLLALLKFLKVLLGGFDNSFFLLGLFGKRDQSVGSGRRVVELSHDSLELVVEGFSFVREFHDKLSTLLFFKLKLVFNCLDTGVEVSLILSHGILGIVNNSLGVFNTEDGLSGTSLFPTEVVVSINNSLFVSSIDLLLVLTPVDNCSSEVFHVGLSNCLSADLVLLDVLADFLS